MFNDYGKIIYRVPEKISTLADFLISPVLKISPVFIKLIKFFIFFIRFTRLKTLIFNFFIVQFLLKNFKIYFLFNGSCKI